MSRIGNQPIIIPDATTIVITGNKIDTKGPKGSLSIVSPSQIKVEVINKEIVFTRKGDNQKIKALHGLIRSLVQNAVTGVNQYWTKTLSLVGVGFRASTDGKKLTLIVGFSHPVVFIAPDGITFTVVGNDVTVTGADKQLVGETAARIRRIKKPEVYKGKGIRYKNELIHLKPGKAAKTVGGVGTGAK